MKTLPDSDETVDSNLTNAFETKADPTVGASDRAAADLDATLDSAPNVAESNKTAIDPNVTLDSAPNVVDRSLTAIDPDATLDSAPGNITQVTPQPDPESERQAQSRQATAVGQSNTIKSQPKANTASDPRDGSSSPPWGTHTADVQDSSIISRYRTLRSHAKGGLGEVFVALDQELGREVALKEIQSRHADQPESRSRFLLEAEVTGGLEHPGIVPVYGLGRYPDGRPYYAMRFIRGHSLRDAIDAYHSEESPILNQGDREVEFRKLLNQFVDVCNALAYAHARRIIHRDIKPANIMLGAFGETLVVDWGLAKALDAPETEEVLGLRPLRPMSAGTTSETLYGTTIGTPQYMSPEQAEGRLDILGPAADIYSLGATLYTILTGKTPYESVRITVLLAKVRNGDIIPPRQRNHNVPPALEAICLKAMARDPEERYPSAKALADDVERWLADEPVSVYREPLFVRLARWVKRHKTLVASSAALLCTATVALAVGTVLIKREQQRTEENFFLARAAVDQMLTQLGEVELADVPQMEPVRKKMLGQALTFYQTFLAQRAHDTSLRHETARAYLRLGDIQDMLGDYAGAEPSFQRAVPTLLALGKTDPKNPILLRDLGRAQHSLGILFRKVNRFSESERAFRAALATRKQLTNVPSPSADDQEAEKNTVYHLGALLARMGGTRQDVDAAYREAIEAQKGLTTRHPDRPSYRSDLARYLNNQGILLARNEPQSAEAIYREALAIQLDLADRSPAVASYQWQLARTLSNLGTPLEFEQRFDEALATYQKALGRIQQLADSFPSVPDYQSELAAIHGNLGMVLRRQKDRVAEAEHHLQTALDQLAGLTKRFPNRPDLRLKTAQVRRALAIILANSNRKPEAEAAFRSSLETLQNLGHDYPNVPEYQSELALALDSLALLLDANGKVNDAVKLVKQAIDHQKQAYTTTTRNALSKQYLLTDYQYLEKMLSYLRDYTQLSLSGEELIQLLPDDPAANYRAARLHAQAATLALNSASSGSPSPRRQETVNSLIDSAIKDLKRAVGAGYRPPDGLKDRVFDVLRERDEFQRLKTSLEQAPKAA